MGNDDKSLDEIVRKLAEIANDHEQRLRWLERGAAMALGILAFVQFVSTK